MQIAKNLIFTGVAGTGKTYHLQQIAKDYTEVLSPVDQQQILTTLVQPLNWREVICLVFLQQRQQGCELLKVAEIVDHPFFQAKASINRREKSLQNQVWGELQKYSSPESKTVKQKNRASQAFFDKDSSSNWYLLTTALPLLTELQGLLDEYQNAQTQLDNHNVNSRKKERYSLVSFHQAYGYDEFVEGIRPVIDEQTGQMRYCIQQGAFLKLCQQAKNDPQHRYAMLIDEINRANVTQVFGELMSLIEANKRAGQTDEMKVQLAYSGQDFSVPNNVDIFATMNTQDYSLVNLDSAFRRRFEFVELLPASEELGQLTDHEGNPIALGKLLEGLNKRIIQRLGKQYQLGHAYFYHVKHIHELLGVMVRQILPQLIDHATQFSHQPQALVAILALNKTPWLVTDTGDGQGTHNQLTQASYQINPELQSLLNKVDPKQMLAMNSTRTHQHTEEQLPKLDSQFLTASAFEQLY